MTESSLGRSIRRLREGQQLSLRTLAERTGFSASFLSQVENGQASPSISSMERIATALGVTLSEFFQVAAAGTPITRADGRAVIQSEWSKARLESLGGSGLGVRLKPMLVTLAAGGSSGKRPYASRCEEFALLLEGSAVLTLGEEEQTLDLGDSVVIPAGMLRRWRNETEREVRILIVASG
jgi:transcriptional regulator with XRE-family HTH domain